MTKQQVQDPTYIHNQRDPVPGSVDPLQGAQAAQSARRAPGQRALTDRECEQRQIALGATVPSKQEAMCQCTKVLHFSVFFDGTDNNRYVELAKDVSERALSNVAKLFDAHTNSDANAVRVYVPGVGTKYPEIGDSGGAMGKAIGTGADQRVQKALDLLDEEIAKVPPQQKILLINIVVFGFSRGAAQARAFIRDLAAKCSSDEGAYKYQGWPLRVAFAGVFDTVCSAYDSKNSAAFSTNGGHNGWAQNMKLPPVVEQSVHMIAAHEARKRFPLDSTRIDAAYPDNTVEIWYPGVHSDVGGGYAPQAQGRENSVSRFALNEMFDVAFSAGVLFQPIADLPGRVRDEFNKDDPALRIAFNAYLGAVPLKTGPMEEVQAAHMELLHRWLKERVREGAKPVSGQRLEARKAKVKTDRDALRREKSQWLRDAGAEGPNDQFFPEPRRSEYDAIVNRLLKAENLYDDTNAALNDLRQEDAKYVRDVADIVQRATAGEKLSLRERTIRRAWDDNTPLPDGVRQFFDLFAHDSVAHFNFDTTRLSDWRTIYFGDSKYKPS